jgi:hypothetical protein
MDTFLCWFIGHFAPPDYAIYCPHYWCDRCKKQVAHPAAIRPISRLQP